MHPPRFHVDSPLPVQGTVDLGGAAARHIATVLRLRAGATITLFDGRGGEYRATLLNATRDQVRVRLLEHQPIEREAPWPLSLALCVGKGSKMDMCVQKATELGATRIQPLISRRGVVRLDGSRAARRQQHWCDIVSSASEQCGRNRLAEVAPVADFDAWLGQCSGSGQRLLLSPQGDRSLRQCPPPSADGMWILIGPEGGFTDAELAAAARQGFETVSFGPRVLRTETAAIAVLAAVLALWGER